MKSTELSIGDVAHRFGLASHVLRHWEAVGLLGPARAGGRRRYGADDLYRVAVILRAKQAGLGLDQIRQMIATTDRTERTAILTRQRQQLQQRLAATQQALDLVNGALTCEHPDFTACPHFQRTVTAPWGLPAPA